jgi:hypothetical protein
MRMGEVVVFRNPSGAVLPKLSSFNQITLYPFLSSSSGFFFTTGLKWFNSFLEGCVWWDRFMICPCEKTAEAV